MLQILHKPSGTEVDCPDPLHCPHLCLFLLALPALLQLRQLLCLLLRSERLLRGLRDLQLLESLLRISRILLEIRGRPIKSSYFYCTCCLAGHSYNIGTLRFCKQGTLQFCFIKPIMSLIVIILQAYGLYQDGDWNSPGYLPITVIYNLSISIALYALFLFYWGTKEMLRPYDPALKFICVKSVIFLSFWQGIVLAVMEQVGLIQSLQSDDGSVYTEAGTVSAGYQNFLICIEMFFAAILMKFAFPISNYMTAGSGTGGASTGRNVTMQSISSTLRETMNPRDIMTDALHNFHPQYSQYTQYSSENKRFQSQPGAGAQPSEQQNNNMNVSDQTCAH